MGTERRLAGTPPRGSSRDRRRDRGQADVPVGHRLAGLVPLRQDRARRDRAARRRRRALQRRHRAGRADAARDVGPRPATSSTPVDGNGGDRLRRPVHPRPSPIDGPSGRRRRSAGPPARGVLGRVRRRRRRRAGRVAQGSARRRARSRQGRRARRRQPSTPTPARWASSCRRPIPPTPRRSPRSAPRSPPCCGSRPTGRRSRVAGGRRATPLRRIAWHVLDHAWEIEDRSEPGPTA